MIVPINKPAPGKKALKVMGIVFIVLYVLEGAFMGLGLVLMGLVTGFLILVDSLYNPTDPEMITQHFIWLLCSGYGVFIGIMALAKSKKPKKTALLQMLAIAHIILIILNVPVLFFSWLNVFMIDTLFATGYPGLIFTPDTFSLANIIELILPTLILISATMNQTSNKKHKDTPKCHPTP